MGRSGPPRRPREAPMRDEKRDPDATPADNRRTRMEQARERAQRAGSRAAELHERQARLVAGGASTDEDVTRAREAAATGVQDADDALSRAIAAHGQAASAHGRVADYLEKLSRQG